MLSHRESRVAAAAASQQAKKHGLFGRKRFFSLIRKETGGTAHSGLLHVSGTLPSLYLPSASPFQRPISWINMWAIWECQELAFISLPLRTLKKTVGAKARKC